MLTLMFQKWKRPGVWEHLSWFHQKIALTPRKPRHVVKIKTFRHAVAKCKNTDVETDVEMKVLRRSCLSFAWRAEFERSLYFPGLWNMDVSVLKNAPAPNIWVAFPTDVA